MNQSSSSDPVGQSADTNRTQITGCVDDSLRTRIAAVVAAHRDQCGDCSCGWESWEESWDTHLADALIRELGLRLDTTCHIHDRQGKQRCHRYVTEWTADE